MSTIGVLTTSYPRHPDDISGSFVRGMVRALARRGHRLEVLVPEPEPEGEPPLRDEGVEVVWVPYAPSRLRRTFYGAGVPDNVRRDPRAWLGLVTFPVNLLRESRRRASGWDALLSHWAVPSGIVAGRVRDGRPHLAVLHSADVHLMRRLPRRPRWAAELARGATELLFASDALRRELLSWLPAVERADLAGRCHSCAMGIDPLPEVAPRRALRAQLGMRRFTVLSLGRLVPIKGLAHAIEAVSQLEDVELWIAGRGPQRAELESLARARRAPARFLGEQTGRAKAELLAAADVFIVPSVTLPSGRTEGTPTALLEAALAGLPIVASPSGGIREVLRDGTSGLLVEARAGPLADAIERVRGDRALRRRLRRGARTLGEAYLWSALGPRVEELLLRDVREAK